MVERVEVCLCTVVPIIDASLGAYQMNGYLFHQNSQFGVWWLPCNALRKRLMSVRSIWSSDRVYHCVIAINGLTNTHKIGNLIKLKKIMRK